MATTERPMLLSPITPTKYVPAPSIHYALDIALDLIRQHGAIEDTKLAAMVELQGCNEAFTNFALVRIIDNVQHGLWTEELGRLPVSILDARAESGEESWAYVWIG